MPAHHQHGDLRGGTIDGGERLFDRVHGIAQRPLQAVFLVQAQGAGFCNDSGEGCAVAFDIGTHRLCHGDDVRVIAEHGGEGVQRLADGDEGGRVCLERGFIGAEEKVLLVSTGLQQALLHIVVQVVPVAGLGDGGIALADAVGLPPVEAGNGQHAQDPDQPQGGDLTPDPAITQQLQHDWFPPAVPRGTDLATNYE